MHDIFQIVILAGCNCKQKMHAFNFTSKFARALQRDAKAAKQPQWTKLQYKFYTQKMRQFAHTT